MRRTIAVIIIFITAVFMLPAEEVYFSSIVNASYLTDFALNLFPVSFWGEFGIDNLDFFPNLTSRAVVRVEAGMTQRTLRQWPSDGGIIPIEKQKQYTVVFSDGKAGFSQGLVDNPEPGRPDFLVLDVFFGMRWEQAFPSLKDIQEGNYDGFFNCGKYFPDGMVSSIGVPELNGTKYSLTNSFSLGLTFNNMLSHYLVPEGYNFAFDITVAPWWLMNTSELMKGIANTGSPCSRGGIAGAPQCNAGCPALAAQAPRTRSPQTVPALGNTAPCSFVSSCCPSCSFGVPASLPTPAHNPPARRTWRWSSSPARIGTRIR